ncbi:cartilage oligomeric matrix protein-like [Pecten maximus]|uniref:cartilage oligomeric matrix protein-like n=1 Tax=Pecten maximus TaxID=6579 RepID=UPI0014586E82|nr:cartilage oligomeric matrix protein-like [Pecten maximus]
MADGSFYCGECLPGYIGNPTIGCRLGDFCLSGENNCNVSAECHYITLGGFRCTCRSGWAGDGIQCGNDTDGDGISDAIIPCSAESCMADNCQYVANGGQEDNDKDNVGDVCDDDDDNDYIADVDDNCQYVANRLQTDIDGDGRGDDCDNCINDVNYDQSDVDGDGLGDVCDDDIDGDTILNGFDNCPYEANIAQTDTDGDTVGDICDNCKNFPNAAQTDTNQNEVGDDCDGQDSDGDGVIDFKDNCVHFPNSVQTDSDNDGIGDACDEDIDGDGVSNKADNCVYVANPGQEMLNGKKLFLVDSGIAPSTSYAYALYHGCNTAGITTLLWQDPDLTGWELGQGYRWTIEHSPSVGILRVCVDQGDRILVDSGYVLDVSIHGGRLGVFSYNQTGSHWSNLQYSCTERMNKALQLNGSTYGEIGTFYQLSIDYSFSLEAWVYLSAGYLTTKQPIMCSMSGDVCLYVESSTFHVKVGDSIIDGTRVLMAETWTHIITVYEAQHNRVTLYVDGTTGLPTQDKRIYGIPELTWNTSDILFLGRDNNSFFNGMVDEVKLSKT